MCDNRIPAPPKADVCTLFTLGLLAHLLLLGGGALDEALALVVGLADTVNGVDLLGL